MAGRLTAAESHAERLRALPQAEWREYLRRHSGLPGPRGNLELADAFSSVADRGLILQLADSEDEYERFCGTQSIGRLVVEDPGAAALIDLLLERATDDLWRVREAVARALQIVGDHDPERLAALVAEWAESPHPFVRRAAVAAICEPRLLSGPAMRSAALAACRAATASIEALPASERAAPDVRNLRQALGYCWSVAVAADPASGLPEFERISTVDDTDVRWIVAENMKKARLKRIIAMGLRAL